MPKINIYNITGKKSGQVTLPRKIFAAKINGQLMAQAVRVYLSNQRKAHPKVKTRGEVAGSGRKIWRQKGTGRARHGDRYAPIFVGGGVAHGPTGRENYQLKMSRRMRQQALFSALTSKFKDGEIVIVQGLAKIEPKTKKMIKILKTLGQDQKLTIILPGIVENVTRAARNVKRVNLTKANLLNTYEVLNGGKLIFMKESIDKLKEIWI